MRKKALFFPVLAALMLAGCSNDDISEVIPDDTPKVFTGDEAYISVRLADAGSIYSRGETSDPGYEYGSDDEHTVKNAYFYFYDKDGVFVSKGSAWNSGTESTGEPAENIEFKSNTVVVLKGLTQKNYPKYMVTVLNKPSDFEPGQTLGEMENTLSDKDDVGIWNMVDDVNYFTMSTTSYKRSGDTQYYFVTEVEDENFSLKPIDDDKNVTNYVPIYVERLAAKVTLKISQTSSKTLTDGTKLYEIQTTVSGSENGPTGDNENIAAEKLYVRIYGWKLNATAKYSNIVKNIDETWTDEYLGFSWEKATDYRSLWGKSFNYGKSGYPPENAADKSEYLNYVNLQDDNNSPLLELEKSGYCAENTNTSEIVSANFPSAVTSVLLKTEVCDENGSALDLVRYKGVLYKKEAFLKYILSGLKANEKLNYWTTIDDKTYTRIDDKFVKLENVGDGVVKVVFEKPEDVTTIYKNKDDSYSKVDDFTELNEDLAEASTDAIGYKGGLMYYNIPIEHLNQADVSEADGQKTIPEAKYGVVRNHHYVVNITKLENMGHGIFNPDEAIVPGDDKETYYVGANINILSWKIVEQNVEL